MKAHSHTQSPLSTLVVTKLYRFNFPTRQVLIYDSRRLYISQLSDLKLCIKLSLKVKSQWD